MTIPRIALTSGEPAGIGPDLCLKLAQTEHSAEIVVLADPELLMQRARKLKLKLTIIPFQPDTLANPTPAGSLKVWPISLSEAAQPGQLNPANSAAVVKMIQLATEGCQHRIFDAMVTAPVQKSIINEAGINFTGHTEYIAQLTGGHPVMMLAIPELRVALATTHLPLSAVSAAITADTLSQTIKILDRDLTHYFDIKNPSILVCGLNPHAGENGHLGREEIEIITPVIHTLREQHFNLLGPLPADTLFTPKYLDQADAVLAMYHDQGLPVLKYKGFGKAVNITLGLPIIRTSVDHGTALDLAGTGKISTGSLDYAIQLAQQMSANNLRNPHA